MLVFYSIGEGPALRLFHVRNSSGNFEKFWGKKKGVNGG
jgi:hypothetical protein